jgi:hypothetical protein
MAWWVSATSIPAALTLVELLTGPWGGVGQVDDIEDLRTAAGDPHGSHGAEAGSTHHPGP